MASEELFKDVPAFPNDIPTASMTTIRLESLRIGEKATAENIHEACQQLGFFLLDLRGDDTGKALIKEIDHIFSLCRDLMNSSQEVKEKYQHDIPKTFLG